jgi:hypothetical protein
MREITQINEMKKERSQQTPIKYMESLGITLKTYSNKLENLK